MSTFRTNALQHAVFFRFFLDQSVSYSKIPDAYGRLPKIELPSQFINRVNPLFSQLCDPYTSYNEGVYGITLKQLTHQSELLFGKISSFFGERVFSYLLSA